MQNRKNLAATLGPQLTRKRRAAPQKIDVQPNLTANPRIRATDDMHRRGDLRDLDHKLATPDNGRGDARLQRSGAGARGNRRGGFRFNRLPARISAAPSTVKHVQPLRIDQPAGGGGQRNPQEIHRHHDGGVGVAASRAPCSSAKKCRRTRSRRSSPRHRRTASVQT